MSFARGLSEDYTAVMNALRYDCSNGQLEGQVNRSKLIKRMVYGRAKFDFLRARVLHSA
jgi:transposase